jgi:glucose-6-phosphate isomerase
VIPVEFIAVRETSHERLDLAPAVRAALEDQHAKLLANCLAQSQALMQGRPDSAGHRGFPGNRPSTTLMLERLDPHSLGALLALYEHRVFTAGAVWGLNSFDQWGVELGKTLCGELLPRLASGDASGLDGSTAGLLARLRR